MASRCASCDAEILWAKTENDKAICLDATPVPTGNIILTRVDGHDRARWLKKDQLPPDPLQPRYVSHFATCPNADLHRKRRAL